MPQDGSLTQTNLTIASLVTLIISNTAGGGSKSWNLWHFFLCLYVYVYVCLYDQICVRVCVCCEGRNYLDRGEGEIREFGKRESNYYL